MARQYFRKRDPHAHGPNTEWIEMSGQEFYQFVSSPEGRGRYFIDLDNIVIETPKEMYKEWHREQFRLNYWAEQKTKDGVVFLSLDSDAIAEHGTGEDVIPDPTVCVEDEVLLLTELEPLRAALAQLDQPSYQLIYCLYLAKNRRTERELAQEFGISQAMINKRKKKILKRLKFLVIKFQKNLQ